MNTETEVIHNSPLLKISELTVGFQTENGFLKALREIDLEIQAGEILALVGESGSGKTLTGLSILNLIEPPGKITQGKISLKSENILAANESQIRKIRGGKIAMIFQEPMTALNPVFTVGSQILEVLQEHTDLSKDEAVKKAITLIESTGIPEPELRYNQYPFQLSGGMRQRIMIAMALATDPELLIADEPTTALDVTIQAQILRLIKELNVNRKMAVLLITHDLGIVSQIADRVAIMYAGKIVETGPVAEIIRDYRHPYTEGLFQSLPQTNKKARLKPIPGQVPSLNEIDDGCSFRNRCPYKLNECTEPVPVTQISPLHSYRCLNPAQKATE